MKAQLLVLLLTTSSLCAKDMRIVTPYFGSFSNTLKANGGKLEDQNSLKGLYVQWVNPSRFQANLFLYTVNDVNSSDVSGSHVIFDYYRGHSDRGRWAVGAGVEYLRIKTAMDEFAGAHDFKMTLDVSAPYARAGRYLNFTQQQNRYSIFLWGGYERDMISGEHSFSIIIPTSIPPSIVRQIKTDLNETYDYALAGIALHGTFFHFFDIQFKIHRKFGFDAAESSNVVSLLTNVFVTRHLGVSYRFKTMKAVFGEGSYCINTYHLGGLIVMF